MWDANDGTPRWWEDTMMGIEEDGTKFVVYVKNIDVGIYETKEEANCVRNASLEFAYSERYKLLETPEEQEKSLKEIADVALRDFQRKKNTGPTETASTDIQSEEAANEQTADVEAEDTEAIVQDLQDQIRFVNKADEIPSSRMSSASTDTKDVKTRRHSMGSLEAPVKPYSYFIESNKKWRAMVTKIYIGSYNSEEEARCASIAAAECVNSDEYREASHAERTEAAKAAATSALVNMRERKGIRRKSEVNDTASTQARIETAKFISGINDSNEDISQDVRPAKDAARNSSRFGVAVDDSQDRPRWENTMLGIRTVFEVNFNDTYVGTYRSEEEAICARNASFEYAWSEEYKRLETTEEQKEALKNRAEMALRAFQGTSNHELAPWENTMMGIRSFMGKDGKTSWTVTAKNIYVGCYDNKDEAICARNASFEYTQSDCYALRNSQEKTRGARLAAKKACQHFRAARVQIEFAPTQSLDEIIAASGVDDSTDRHSNSYVMQRGIFEYPTRNEGSRWAVQANSIYVGAYANKEEALCARKASFEYADSEEYKRLETSEEKKDALRRVSEKALREFRRGKETVAPDEDVQTDSSAGRRRTKQAKVERRKDHSHKTAATQDKTAPVHALMTAARTNSVSSKSKRPARSIQTKSKKKAVPTKQSEPPGPFAETVHDMVTKTARLAPELIRWICDGEAFIVSHKNPKLKTEIHKFFDHGKYTSLQRQLNMYGWKKHTAGRYKGAFHHPYFHRDRLRSDLSRIRRNQRPADPVNTGEEVPEKTRILTRPRVASRKKLEMTRPRPIPQPRLASRKKLELAMSNLQASPSSSSSSSDDDSDPIPPEKAPKTSIETAVDREASVTPRVFRTRRRVEGRIKPYVYFRDGYWLATVSQMHVGTYNLGEEARRAANAAADCLNSGKFENASQEERKKAAEAAAAAAVASFEEFQEMARGSTGAIGPTRKAHAAKPSERAQVKGNHVPNAVTPEDAESNKRVAKDDLAASKRLLHDGEDKVEDQPKPKRQKTAPFNGASETVKQATESAHESNHMITGVTEQGDSERGRNDVVTTANTNEE